MQNLGTEPPNFGTSEPRNPQTVVLGHFALGFSAKRIDPRVSLGTLFLACQFADLVWPTLVLFGIERVVVEPGNTAYTPLRFAFYPYSHSLTALLVWALVVGAAYRAIGRYRALLHELVGER